MATITFDPRSVESYRRFTEVKKLPVYRIRGMEAWFPDEYAHLLGMQRDIRRTNWSSSEFLFDYQRDIAAMAIRKRKFAVFADCGLGKGLLPDCPVLTPTGFRKLGDIREGDFVIGSNGKATKVIGVFDRGPQTLYRVNFSDGTHIFCDGDHLWAVKSPNDAARGKDWRVMETRELAASNLRYGKAGKSRTWRIPLAAPVEYCAADPLPLSPYILGVLLGDGALSNGQPMWAKDDDCVASRVADELPGGCRIVERAPSDRCKCYSIVSDGQANPVTAAMRDMGLMGKLSYEKFVPEVYLRASIEDRIALLQGLMDTDGYAGDSPEFCSTSRYLADAVREIVLSIGGTARIAAKESPRYTHNGEYRTGRTAYRVTLSMPPGINPFHCSRKADEFKTPSRGLGRWIDSIELGGHGRTICIKVAADDGLFVAGKDFIVTHNTLIFLEFAQAAQQDLAARRKGVLMVSPLMVIQQTIDEARRFYPGLDIEIVKSSDIGKWARSCGGKIGITNYEAFNEPFHPGEIGGLIPDESSMLKSHYGKWASGIVEVGRGLDWVLPGTGTPAPNDRIEYANHAVLLGQFPTVNAFLATYFVNKGQTSERWVLKEHALEGFYRSLSHWSIFLSNPATYGWKDNCGVIPPIETHIDDVPLTPEQRALVQKLTGKMVATKAGGISSRGSMGQIAKGNYKGQEISTEKPRFIRDLVGSFGEESTIIWCRYNPEQDGMAKLFPDAANIDGKTKLADRLRMIREFQAGERRVLISKPKILGFGLNLQIATRQVFSTLQDSYEEYYQAVKRSNRTGSTKPLHVHIPITEIEAPMVETVLAKADRVQVDTQAQEEIFKRCSLTY